MNDPAFPTDNAWESNRGLTKRELFAAMAMQGLLSHHDATISDLAFEAVLAADALIKALE